jgi:hypothetical protein
VARAHPLVDLVDRVPCIVPRDVSDKRPLEVLVSGGSHTQADEVFRNALENLAGQPRLSGLADAIAAAREQLGEPMRVAIAGRIKAGKSTMTNAMLGEMLVATGREELTFNVNRLRFGEERSLVVHYKDGLSEPRSLLELESLTRRREEHQELLASIEHIEVFYPNELLRSFNLIDTPGVESFFGQDSQNTLEFLNLSPGDVNARSERESRDADALLWLFTRSLSTSDEALVAEFTGPTLGNASPINTIGALTQVDRFWKDEQDPLQAGERVCRRLYSEPQVARHFYRLQPVCGKIGLAAQTLTGHEAETLGVLAGVADDVLRQALETTRRFTERGLPGADVPAEDRRAVLDRLDQYGVLLACRILRKANGDAGDLERELLRHSGVGELRELVISHFGRRASQIKLMTALRRVRRATFQQRRQATGHDRGLIDEVARTFEALEEAEHGFAELGVLQQFYAGNLRFEGDNATELLRVAGEFGVTLEERLGLERGAPLTAVIEQAEQRARRWRTLCNDFGLDRKTLRAARVLARSYDRILHRARQLQEAEHELHERARKLAQMREL